MGAVAGAPPEGALDWAVAEATRRAGGQGRRSGVRVLRERPTVVVSVGDVVVKVHEAGTDVDALAARLTVAHQLAGHGLVLGPADLRPLPVPDGRRPFCASVWPRVEPLDGDPDGVPWAEAGALLAALHAHGPVPGAPEHRAPWRLGRDLAGMERALVTLTSARSRAGAAVPGRTVTGLCEAADVVRAGLASLPAHAREASPAGRPVTVVHGDFHLGQLARPLEGDRGWLLIDIDELGNGDPLWDLARPAAFWACGLLADEEWGAFVEGYRGGVPGEGGAAPGAPALTARDWDDPWPLLDRVARPCVVQTAASSVRRAVERVLGITTDPRAGDVDERGLDDVDRQLLAVCARIAAGP